MFLKKIIATLCGLCLFSTVNADDLSELKKMLLKQQQEIQNLQKKVKEQESLHNDALSHYIKMEVKHALKNQNSNLLTLGNNIENLKVTGDFRLRYQRQETNNRSGGSGNESRDRLRLRFRLGFIWTTDEGWELGAGISTGGNGAGSGRSANQTLNSGGTVFETNDLNLDFAYAKHSWKHTGRTSTLILGQMKNPFITSGGFWDSDLRPTGIAYQYKTTGEGTQYFLTAGAFTVAHLNSGRDTNDVTMYSAQAGLKAKRYLLAVAYHNVSDDFAKVQNDVASSSAFQNKYQILDIYGEYKFKLSESKWTLFGQLAYNLGASDTNSHIAGLTDKEDLSWLLGVKTQFSDFKFSYEYRYMEANGQPAAFTDSNFGAGNSNHQGHVLSAAYSVSKSLSLGLKYYITEAIEKSTSSDDRENLLQANVQYKF